MKNKILYIAFFIIVILAGCSADQQIIDTIRIKGSDTMLPLTQRLAAEYMKLNPNISIYVEGGGTANGVDALINGDVDIATASRSLRAEEAKKLANYYGSLGLYFLIAKDALSIYLNPDNPVKDLTLQQLKDMFTCKITNWKELGGNDEDIILVTRSPNSGTFLYFKEHVLEDEEYCDSVIVRNTTEAVIDYIHDHKNAIGYGGIGYKNIYHAYINGYQPSEENARNDTYPITRYLHFFTSKTPKGIVKDFIDWVLTPDGQKIIKDSGFIPLWSVSY